MAKYKDAIHELHPQAMRLKVVMRANEKLRSEIIRLEELTSSDFNILTKEMERLRSEQHINAGNEIFATECRMKLDDYMLNKEETNTR